MIRGDTFNQGDWLLLHDEIFHRLRAVAAVAVDIDSNASNLGDYTPSLHRDEIESIFLVVFFCRQIIIVNLVVQPQTWNHHGKPHTHIQRERERESQLYSLTCIIGHPSIDRQLAMLNDPNSVVPPNWRDQRLDALFRSLHLSRTYTHRDREKEQRQHY